MKAKSPEAIARRRLFLEAYRQRPEVMEAARERSRKAYAKKCAQRPPKEPKPPKPPKAAKRKPPVLVGVMRRPVKLSQDLPVVIPEHVKVQRLPGCPPDHRFHVSPHFKGEFLQQWKRLRGER